jgi:hypothetical protein
MSRAELLHDLPGKKADIVTALATLEEKVGFQLNGRTHQYHWNPQQTPKS